VKSFPIARIFSLLIVIPVLLIALNGCSQVGNSGKPGELAMAAMDSMPAEVNDAPSVVRQAYQFAVANPDTLKHIPCYCGCDDIGHKSNYDCYVSNVDAAGKVTIDAHALGCSICVDITQDTMRMLREGKAIPEIQAAIDQTYSQYGPPTLP